MPKYDFFFLAQKQLKVLKKQFKFSHNLKIIFFVIIENRINKKTAKQIFSSYYKIKIQTVRRYKQIFSSYLSLQGILKIMCINIVKITQQPKQKKLQLQSIHIFAMKLIIK